MVETFGAPVTEPLGNRARKIPTRSTSGRSSAVIVEVSCQTVSYRSTRNSWSQATPPGTEIRPRSLRRRSTIIAFSARSLAEAASRRAASSSSSSHRPRGAVPFIGRVVMRFPSRRKNSSGEAEQIR
ncbi:MAG: hypothetical protein KatS3mg014_0323 [Actinomycetota bacterium]|nr:MAG: hypothetical protein KatS3mg014_0323 [Actinomycetota bacterium]